MVREVLENLHINKSSQYIDATLGTGGHSLEIIKAGGEVLGIEADPKMLAIAKKRVPGGNFILGNFIGIDKIAKENDFNKVSGILFDLGVTNLHLTGDDRGFSFGSSNLESGLDMRLNPEVQGVTAADLLNGLREDQLISLFETTMEMGNARWLARRIFLEKPTTIGGLLKICRELKSKSSLNPATLPFLAVRIAVNSELDNLRDVLPKAFELLKPGGKLIVISFHSGEDRIAKEFAKNRLILPGAGEIRRNPRARSAKLRIYEKI